MSARPDTCEWCPEPANIWLGKTIDLWLCRDCALKADEVRESYIHRLTKLEDAAERARTFLIAFLEDGKQSPGIALGTLNDLNAALPTDGAIPADQDEQDAA